MREIPLTKGYIALVDDEDYTRLVAMGSWYALETKHTVYACRKNKFAVLMHREIMHLPKGDKREVDHDDGNGLNNQKYNLDVGSAGQNRRNQHTLQSRNISGHVGVTWMESLQKWRARIVINRKDIHLGVFNTIEEAATTRNEAAKEFGFKR